MKTFVSLSLLFFCFTFIPLSSANNIPDITTTPKEQVGLELAVYSSSFALVKDTRRVKLKTGNGKLVLVGIPSSIIPQTVHVRTLSKNSTFSVLEQSYEYDLITPEKLLDKYVGKEIKIIDQNEFKDRKDVISALLLSNNNGQVYKINNEIYLGHRGYKVLSELPDGLVSRPTLAWLYDNKTNKEQELEISYLTNNITWKTDYTLIYREGVGDLSSWVTVENNSGVSYRNAKLKLVAGEVHREREMDRSYTDSRRFAKSMAFSAVDNFKEEPMFEYHTYNLKRNISLNNKQAKQVKLLSAFDIKMEKEFLFESPKIYFTRRYMGGALKQPVNTYITFGNVKENNIAAPMPAGVIRVYKQDNLGSMYFVGEDSIKHTPKGGEIKLNLGRAFDVLAKRTQVNYQKISTNLYESEWEITLENHKTKDVLVGVVENMVGNWRMINSSHEYKKLDAFRLRFNIIIPAGSTSKVNYKVRVGL